MNQVIDYSKKYFLNYFNIKNVYNIENVQNISLFMISFCSLFSYIYYNFSLLYYDRNSNDYELLKYYDRMLPFVGVHAFIDLFFNKSYDLKVHHLFVLLIIFSNEYYNVSLENRFIFSYPLLNTEISSIFFVLKYWLPEKTFIYNINLILFYSSFLKFRIYDFYYKIIYNHNSFNILFQQYPNSIFGLLPLVKLACYGLFILNLYWFLILTKILYKNITKIIKINNDITCHYLCSYSLFINILISFYIYSYNPNEKNMYDTTGNIILSISSYLYHYDVYKKLANKQIEDYSLPNENNILHFLNDCLSINVRSFLAIVTNYYHNKFFLQAIVISILFHINSVYHLFINILNLFINSDKTYDSFLNNHNIIMGIPIFFDTFLIFFNSQNEIGIPFLITNILISLLFLVEPFYRLNQFAFHILLIVQNYYICMSSINY